MSQEKGREWNFATWIEQKLAEFTPSDQPAGVSFKKRQARDAARITLFGVLPSKLRK